MSLGIIAASHVPFATAPSWSPSDEGGLTAWFRVEDLSLSDNDDVTTWADQSGNSRTLTRPYGSTYAKYKTGITPGGQPVVRFVDSVLSTAGFSTDPTCSLFFYGTCPSVANTVAMHHGDANSSGYGFYAASASAFRGLFGGKLFVGTTTPSATFKSYGLLVNNPDGDFLVDNASAGTASAGGGINSTSLGLHIGGDATGSPLYGAFDLCEVVYFDHVLDATARSNLQTYFENKYE